MLRRLVTTLAVAMAAVSAHAQAPANPTAVEHPAGSLAQLLDNGWTIQSVSGQNGQYLLLEFNGRKWVRCELISPSDPRLRYLTGIIADCRALN